MSTLPLPSSPDWCMIEDGFLPGLLPHYESVFALANGYMGVRASLETNPLLGDPGFYIAGVYDRVRDLTHEIVNLPCWLGLGMNVDGFPVDLRKGVMLEYRRTLDMRQGILFTHIVWRDAGMHTTCFELGRLVHQADKQVALQWGTITPLDYSATVGFTSSIDAWAVKYGSPSGGVRLQDIAPRDLGDDGIGLAASTMATGIRVALATQVSAAGMSGRQARLFDDRIAETAAVPVQQGEPLAFEKRVVAYTSRDVGDPEARAAMTLKELAGQPLATVIDSHTAAWAAIWKDADVRIDGDDRAQKALRFNIFHLASLANPFDDRVSLGAKGLHGNGYNGQVFWDTEIYMLPFYTHTNPAAARRAAALPPSLSRRCPRKRPRIRLPGGVLPVEQLASAGASVRTGAGRNTSAPISPMASTGMFVPPATTNSSSGTGAEIILDTARYWQSRVEHDAEKGYVIGGLTGPGRNPRRHQQQHLHQLPGEMAFAARGGAGRRSCRLPVAGRSLPRAWGIADADVAQWREISEHMYLHFIAELNIHEQFDGYLELPEKAIDRSLSRMQYTGPVQHSFKPTKVAQQADTVLMYWMFAEDFAADIRRAGYQYYEPRCSHTSSLSRCIYAAVAAQTGLLDEAYRQFLISAEDDIAPGAEMESESGIHAACMGGTWLAAITGFAGANLRGDTLSFTPALPAHWTAMSLALAWQGRTLDVEINQHTMRLKTRGGYLMVRVCGEQKSIGAEWSDWISIVNEIAVL